MNIYKSTGKKIESWPQWVGRLTEENKELKKRCCDLFSEVIEAKASSDS
jgi:hypothetical protein